MLDRYPAIYQKIADTLQSELPAGWRKTWAYAEMSVDTASVVVYYLDGAGKVGWIRPPEALFEQFRELSYAARLADPVHAWTTATFRLEPSGQFKVDFGYDAVPIEDELARRHAWKARYLPSPTQPGP